MQGLDQLPVQLEDQAGGADKAQGAQQAADWSTTALLILAAPSFLDPEFEVVNRSSGDVSVVATWRGNERRIGPMRPMSSHRFTLDDEAAITFRVRYASGREVETDPLYFTSGIKVIATISDDGIEVRYDHET